MRLASTVKLMVAVNEDGDRFAGGGNSQPTAPPSDVTRVQVRFAARTGVGRGATSCLAPPAHPSRCRPRTLPATRRLRLLLTT
jgi:hypothetical protein